MKLSPGLAFLSKALPFYIVASASLYAILDILRAGQVHNLPSWAIIAISLFARPIFLIASGYYTDYKHARAAAALGATVIPTVEEKWPISFNTMKKFVDNLHNGYPGDLLVDWKEKYGNTYQICLPLERRVFTFEPDHVKAILAAQFATFEKGPMAFEQAKSMLGSGVFNSDGDMWKFHRTMTRPFFIKDRISDFGIFATHADEALRQATARLSEGYPIDFQDLVSRFTLDSATQFLFGTDVKSLGAGLAYPTSSHKPNPPTFNNHPSNRFVAAFLEGQKSISIRARKGQVWPLAELTRDQMKPNRVVVDEFVTPLMEKAISRKQMKNDELDGEKTESLLDHLAQQTEDPALVNLLVAGRDTVYGITTDILPYMPAEHPDIAQRLRDEVLNKVGATEYPSYENIRDMKYLRAFLNEVLRLYPPVPMNSRTANKDTVFESKTPGTLPLYIPAGTRVSYSVFVMHRRADLWGPDALEFDPDRFIDKRLAKYLTPNPFIFCPFNAGPRICLGQQYAYQEASFFLIRLLQQYSSFSLARDAQPIDSLPPKEWAGAYGPKGSEKIHPQAHLTMYSKGGLWVRMQEANI
ncbi:cytochrome P450 monooxygenase pc-3 [Cyathus striatus]|nr:cytochrome P450 monooxygenase pc-3 [Cyathus striatus]